ncbi:MAG: CDS_ID OB3077 [uncultured Thermomicrobiales bacterium]|uniref:CDS_ID OB3077 n=1 Tax=uncultured Thermomicrobiales bacterium TaxID=1645740 RepID=A0A6J4UGT0_9BACT|nr:MAG: CDS_ID OB3077 [uncultured Thermomicrobiales bacterium]
MKLYALHENPEWFPPFARAFAAAGLDYEEWLLTEGTIDLDAAPPEGIFYNRLSASSHTRDHPYARDYARAVLDWLEAHGRRVVNRRSVVEMEVSKVRQLTALRAFGIDTPRTVAVVGRSGLVAAAERFPVPFITKHNQGGKGLGVRRFDDLAGFRAYVASDEFEEPVDGITLLQEYVQARAPFITRIETVGYDFVYAITADTARGGFQLCPADACELDDQGRPVQAASLFALREGFDHPIVGQVTAFARRHDIEVAGFEFIEAADGRVLVYDVNTNTNYNPDVEAVAPRSGPGELAAYLQRVMVESHAVLV